MSLFLHYLSMPYLLQGIELTLQVTALGLGGGLLLGLILAWMQLSRLSLLSAFARGYTVIFRGTPLILQMVFAYDALPHIGSKLPAVLAAGLALACNEAPFIAEMLRAGVLGVDRGQLLAGQALGMTPSVLMRRIIAPQAIRTMIPAFGNETVSALKNSSLASVIAVQELTLRSTQLASSTFDFFSIFFASGLIYLVLTGAVSVIQLALEWLLDLDRTTRQRKLADYLPWRRVDLATKLDLADKTAPAIEAPAEPAALTETPPLALTREQRTKRAATIARNNIAVEVSDLRKAYDGHTVLNGLDLTVRIGEVIALLGPSGSGKSTLLRCIYHLENWDTGTVRVGGKRLGFHDDGKRLSPRAVPTSAPKSASAWCFSSSTCSAISRPRRMSLVPCAGCTAWDDRTPTGAQPSCWSAWASVIAPMRCRGISPVASSSASRSPAHWRRIRACCCWTSRPRRSTLNWSTRCWR